VTKASLNYFDKYIKYVISWIYVANTFSSKKCANDMTIYIYFTNLTKILPNIKNVVLSPEHVNTAFTRTCPSVSEIVVYRKEEWFKVLMHETIHNLGLDFSDADNSISKRRIKQLFNVNSNVNLYESYAELWARIMNVLYCSYNISLAKRNMKVILNLT
jgi:hypothetical protein